MDLTTVGIHHEMVHLTDPTETIMVIMVEGLKVIIMSFLLQLSRAPHHAVIQFYLQAPVKGTVTLGEKTKPREPLME